jgi:hypothetical protein
MVELLRSTLEKIRNSINGMGKFVPFSPNFKTHKSGERLSFLIFSRNREIQQSPSN